MTKTKQYFLYLLLLQFILFLSACFHTEEKNNTVTYRISQSQELDSSGAVTSTSTSIYNPDGQVIRVDKDSNNDGNTDTVTNYIYNSIGQLIYYELDAFNDGIIEGTATYEYNSEGQLLVVKGNIVDTLSTSTYVYNDKNQVINILIDINNNGVIDSTATFNYNSGGQVTDWTIGNSSLINNYDLSGRILTTEVDESIDGTIDSITTYTYEEGPCTPIEPTSLSLSGCITE